MTDLTKLSDDELIWRLKFCCHEIGYTNSIDLEHEESKLINELKRRLDKLRKLEKFEPYLNEKGIGIHSPDCNGVIENGACLKCRRGNFFILSVGRPVGGNIIISAGKEN